MDDPQTLKSVTYEELKDLYIEMQNGNPRYQLPNTAFVKGAMLKFQCGENENTNVINGVKKFMRRKRMYKNRPRTPETEEEKQEIMLLFVSIYSTGHNKFNKP